MAGSSSATAEVASSDPTQEEKANLGVAEGDQESHVSTLVVEDQKGFDVVVNELFHEP